MVCCCCVRAGLLWAPLVWRVPCLPPLNASNPNLLLLYWPKDPGSSPNPSQPPRTKCPVPCRATVQGGSPAAEAAAAAAAAAAVQQAPEQERGLAAAIAALGFSWNQMQMELGDHILTYTYSAMESALRAMVLVRALAVTPRTLPCTSALAPPASLLVRALCCARHALPLGNWALQGQGLRGCLACACPVRCPTDP